MLLTFFIYDKHRVTSEGRVCEREGGRERDGALGCRRIGERVRGVWEIKSWRISRGGLRGDCVGVRRGWGMS